MVDWKDTAKRLAAHPRFEFDFPMAFVFEGRQHRVPEGHPGAVHWDAIPDLTDWPTAGVMLGMVVEAYPLPRMGDIMKVAQIVARMFGGDPPGQAPAEWLLELWGDA